jgi:hypothetical protein
MQGRSLETSFARCRGAWLFPGAGRVEWLGTRPVLPSFLSVASKSGEGAAIAGPGNVAAVEMHNGTVLGLVGFRAQEAVVHRQNVGGGQVVDVPDPGRPLCATISGPSGRKTRSLPW